MNLPVPSCPKCKKADAVRTKMLMLDKMLGDKEIKRKEDMVGLPEFWYMRKKLNADYIRKDKILFNKNGQFVNGHYCDACNEAFVPDGMLRQIE